MFAFIEITINIVFLAVMILASAAIGLLINNARFSKQKSAISKLEMEMLQSHAEILQLQKELSDKESLQSKTPIFSIRDSAAESADEQLTASSRLSKKVAGERGKTS